MNTKQVKEHMDKAYAWLSKIPVSGEAVDAMAMARHALRYIFNSAGIAAYSIPASIAAAKHNKTCGI